MRIAQVAPLHIAVPPYAYGGTERCISNLTESLVKLGHDVTLFATADSRTSARLVPMREKPLYFDPGIDAVAVHLAELSAVYQHADDFDVIHSHLDYLTAPFARGSATPTVITLHGRLDGHENETVLRAFRELNYIPISKRQQAQLPDLNWLQPVHHGVDVDCFPFSEQPGQFLAFVGRICPEKGPDRAIAIAKRVGIPLKIAANVAPANQAYFEQEIAPLFDDPLIEFLGAANEQCKQELLSHALALLLPISWPEPFGMVFIEALACGTPVLTCPYGSVPELLEDGVTGYMCATDAELAEKVHQVAGISRAGCRDYVRRRFDVRDMAWRYVARYHQVRCLAAARPEACKLPTRTKQAQSSWQQTLDQMHQQRERPLPGSMPPSSDIGPDVTPG
jgi:glycosyltransferase involved in cell wall biosynthesis